MASDVKIEINPWFSVLLVAVGLIEAWKVGQPWYLGLAVGILFGLLSLIGLIPFVGVLVYWFLGKWIMTGLIGIWFGWVFYLGLILAVLYTVIMSVVLVLIMKWY